MVPTTGSTDPASAEQGNLKATGANLRALETIVERNAIKGAEYWRKAADALLEIKTRKLWKLARDAEGEPYATFAAYAEARFGFKKTYAYDLAKAATRKPDALTEGEARAQMKAERGRTPLTRDMALQRIMKAWERFEDSAGEARDRALDDDAFVRAYDALFRKMSDAMRAFDQRWQTVEGNAQ